MSTAHAEIFNAVVTVGRVVCTLLIGVAFWALSWGLWVIWSMPMLLPEGK